ncbi:MAG: translation initiation factor IF-2 [Candidatus Woesearchaeota archaeon]
MIRSPICTVVGHVDHGKSSILDYIRGSDIVKGEAGAITQAIGASIVPIEMIKEKCGNQLKALNLEFTIPGLLFIDTPGHEAFTTLRKRGGNLADIAVVVIDVNDGVKPQTLEAIEILKTYKTPFIIALNKVDKLPGWRTDLDISIQKSVGQQSDKTREVLDKKLYEIVGELNEKFDINSDRFDRVSDYTKQIAMIPCSALTGEGLSSVLMLVAGLAQKYLNRGLSFDVKGKGKGTILEVKEDKGLGTTIDVILYDGNLKVNDTLVIGHTEKPFSTKIRALLLPDPLSEMRDKKSKFKNVKSVYAATGVKICAPNLDNAISGMPIRVCNPQEVENEKQDMMKEIDDITIETQSNGVIVKADTLGSLEAMVKILTDTGINIRKASIGEINKSDLVEAEGNYERDPVTAAILGFNIPEPKLPVPLNVNIITSSIIYKIIEDYQAWRDDSKKREEEKELESMIRPCKFEYMLNHTFRQSNPAIIGADILAGVIKTGMPIVNSKDMVIGTVKSIQLEKESVKRAEAGKQVAVAIHGAAVGRQINEEEVFYADIPEDQFRRLKDKKHLLKAPEIETMKELAHIKRKENPVWGV